MNFELHPNLAKKTFIIDLPLCRILLQDEFNYPWIFLVPRRSDVSRMMDLNQTDQMQLIQELDFAQKVIWNAFKPEQLNVAAIGNKIPQLHIHVIGRQSNDPAWPNTVWDHPTRCPCTPEQKESRLQLLKDAFQEF